MEFDFSERALAEPALPAQYEFVEWDPRDIDRHAVAKFNSFRDEVDAQLFPCLGHLDGCRRLMLEIASQRTFLPEATWLLATRPNRSGFSEDCGMIQGLGIIGESGSVQNVGVVREHRGLGLGRALVLKALHGFRRCGIRRVYLEATAENEPAIELYRSLGFRLIRTTYREVPNPSLAR